MKLKFTPILYTLITLMLLVVSLNLLHAMTDYGAGGAYNILAVSRDNNKIIKVTPNKKIVVNIIEHPDRVGAISRHPAGFIDKSVFIQGYVLKKENGYVIFSDEPTGALGIHDLPVVGAGTDGMVMNKKYMLRGTFTNHGLVASNKSIYHLDLSELPKKAAEQ